MAPAAKDSNAEMLTILNAIASCAEFPIDGKIFAASEGIARSDNAITKFKRVLKNNGFGYEGKKVVRMEGEGSGDSLAAVKTPTKAATPRKPRATKRTPMLKKRKLQLGDDGDEEEIVASGEVKKDEDAEDVKGKVAGGTDGGEVTEEAKGRETVE